MTKKHSIFDVIAASAPANADAAKAFAMTGDLYEKKLSENHPHWKTPQKTIPIPSNMPLEANVMGVQFGRFKVIGYLGRSSKTAKGRWLCRCSCGDYEPRSSAAVRNPANVGDCCMVCRDVIYKRTAHLHEQVPQDVADRIRRESRA